MRCARGILRFRLNRAIGAAFFGAGILVSGIASADACDPNHVDLRWQGGKARFAIELADSFDERAQGLMFRTEMGRYSGMLFVYPEPASVTFWMKNTLIPLDMIFLDRTGLVTRVHENATPQSLETIPGGEGVLAVLEINGGLSRRLGIVAGTQMRHAAFDQMTAVWRCK